MAKSEARGAYRGGAYKKHVSAFLILEIMMVNHDKFYQKLSKNAMLKISGQSLKTKLRFFKHLRPHVKHTERVLSHN